MKGHENDKEADEGEVNDSEWQGMMGEAELSK